MSIHPSHLQEFHRVCRWLAALALSLAIVLVLPAPAAARGLADYLPLHTVLEVIAIAVSAMIFGIAWATHPYQRSGRAAIFGVSFLGVALLDLTHMLSFKGMPDFLTPSDPEKAINFWLLARTLAIAGLLAAALAPARALAWCGRASMRSGVLAMLGFVAVVHAWLLLYPDRVPRTFVPGKGLTAFKLIYEYALIVAALVAAAGFFGKLRQPRSFSAASLAAAACVMAMSEFFLTRYENVTDVYNLLGHIYKIIACGFLYRAVFVETVQSPYQRLFDARARLDTTIDTLPDQLYEIDGQGNFRAVRSGDKENPDDGDRDTRPLRNLADLLSADALQQVTDALRRAEREGTARGTRIKLDANGETQHFELSIARRHTQTSKVPSYLVLSRNVTKTVRQELELARELRLNAALLGLQAARDNHHDDTSLIALAARELETLIPSGPVSIRIVDGCSPDDTPPASDERATSDDRPPSTEPQEADPGTTENSPALEVPIIDAGRARMVIALRAGAGAPDREIRQTCTIIGGALWDLLQHRRQERDILRLSTALGQSPYPIIITDRHARIEYVNEAFTGLCGYTLDEVRGRNPSMFQSGVTPAQTYAELWQSLSAGLPWRGEFTNRRNDGSLYTESALIYPIRDPSGTLINFVAHKEDISVRKAVEARIHQLSNYDQLTGLPNRHTIEDGLEQALAQARGAGQALTVMWMDLDNFKTVNDSLGHAVGDLLLLEVANRLRTGLGDAATVGRHAGDAFVAFLPQTDQGTASITVGRLVDELRRPVRIDGVELSVSLSIGMAVFPDDGQSAERLLMCAEAAMYRMKDEGRNGFRFFTPEMQADSQRALTLSSGLTQAIARGELRLVYQPQLSLADGRLAGAEALLRWRHPELGEIPPQEFVPLAERNGQMVAIGSWVLAEAMRQGRAWLDSGLFNAPDMLVSVNLSAVQFAQTDLVRSITRMAQDCGLPSHCIELELTEAVALTNPLAAANTMKALSRAGFRVAIDDFGTGYSSMSYLKRFSVDRLKIDRSFIREVDQAADDQAIVIAIIQMARSLGMKTIAEGVETEAQARFLLEHGCDQAQGYWFGHPMPAEAFAEFVVAHRARLAIPNEGSPDAALTG